MTNEQKRQLVQELREQADSLEKPWEMSAVNLRRAANAIEESIDPDPVKDLRWLVERHECLSAVMKPDRDPTHGRIVKWRDDTDPEWPHLLNDSRALTVVRGIVRGLYPKAAYWPSDEKPGMWWVNCVGRHFTTELEAIDALLTAMKQKRTE